MSGRRPKPIASTTQRYQPPPRPQSLAGVDAHGGVDGLRRARDERRAIGHALATYDDDAATAAQSRAAAKLGRS